MDRDQLIDIKQYKYCFNTAEAYASNIFISDDKLLIPYINVQISDVNPFDIAIGEKVSFSYLLLSGVSRVEWYGGYNGEKVIGRLILKENEEGCVDYWGISDYEKDFEVKVKCKNKEVFIPSKSTTGITDWVPWKMPHWDVNMIESEVKDFFEIIDIPTDILMRFDKNNMKPLVCDNSTPVVIKQIKKDW